MFIANWSCKLTGFLLATQLEHVVAMVHCRRKKLLVLSTLIGLTRTLLFRRSLGWMELQSLPVKLPSLPVKLQIVPRLQQVQQQFAIGHRCSLAALIVA